MKTYGLPPPLLGFARTLCVLSLAIFCAASARARPLDPPSGSAPSPLPPPPTAPTGIGAAEVLGVADIGTVVLRAPDGSGEMRVRLQGVLVPRVADPRRAAVERRAGELLSDLLAGEWVVVDEQRGSDGEVRRDRDGNAFAMLFRAPDGLCVNVEILRRGWARADTRTGFKHLDLFREYERKARDGNRGVWSGVLPPMLTDQSAEGAGEHGPAPAQPSPGVAPGTVVPVAPQEPRRPAPAAASPVGSATVWVTRSGTRYHQKNCQHAKSDATELPIADAKGRGLSPCRVCKPPE